MSILYTDNPKRGDWKAIPSILHDLQDPALFIDDDDAAYIYWGSSEHVPYQRSTTEKNHRFIRYGTVDTLFYKDMNKNGWERFGENNSDTIPGYIEGPWMTKHTTNTTCNTEHREPSSMFMPMACMLVITHWALLNTPQTILSALNREAL